MNREQWRDKMGRQVGIVKDSSASSSPFGRSPADSAGSDGAPRMDQEHAMLAELIDHLGGICAIGNARDCRGCILLVRDRCHGTLSQLLASLIRYVGEHFRYEERLMDDVLPQEYAVDHKADHDFIRRRLLAHAEEFKSGGNTAAVSHLLIAELVDWLKNHTEAHDAVLASYVASEDYQ